MKNILLPILVLLLCASANSQAIDHKVLILPPKAGESRYYYVPFDVPANTHSLSVSYQYDKKDGANVLDLGVFDSLNCGTENDIRGFRGWSGGRRDTVFISRETASNGYLPGNLPAGKWRVILGLYKIEAGGVNVTVTVRLNEIDDAANAARNTENAITFSFPKHVRTAPPKFGGLTWFRGDLHTHTFHSDGHWTLRSILDYTLANNLDFIGVTEHNTLSHHVELESLRSSYPEILVLAGEEITTYGGHINVWGLPVGMLIDFRVTPGNLQRLAKVLEPARELNLPLSINHPTALCGGCSWTYSDDWTGMDSVEIWNGGWDLQEEAALKKWDDLLVKGSRITAIGSSDSHRPPSEPYNPVRDPSIGSPTTFIGTRTLSQKEILRSIVARRVFITDRADRTISMTAGKAVIGDEAVVREGEGLKFSITARKFPIGSKVRLVSNGLTLDEFKIASEEFATQPELVFSKNTYVRMEVRDEANRMLAMSNPIFIVAMASQ